MPVSLRSSLARIASRLNAALYALGKKMAEYNWRCLVCKQGVDKKHDKCDKCGYPAGASSYEVDARKFLLEQYSSDLKCPKCCKPKLDVKFSKDPEAYYYRIYPVRGRAVFFEILYVIIYCRKCSFKHEFEYGVPILRKLYRLITRSDIKWDWLKRI